MTKEQYMRLIKSVIESPRNNLQKINMLEQGFKLYVAEYEEKLENNGKIKWQFYEVTTWNLYLSNLDIDI